MKIPISHIAKAWDELQALQREDDLSIGDMCWCDFLFVFATTFEIDEDIDVNCADDCVKFETDDCFLC